MGIATTTIYTIDYSFGQYTQPQVFQNEITEVFIHDPFIGQTDPYTGATFQENNPFGLVINSDTTTGVSPAGGINLFSALQADNGYFAQYWDIDIVGDRGGVIEFEGFLRQENRGEAIAVNTINTSNNLINSVPQLGGLAFPETIAEGTTIRGLFTSDQTEFRAIIEGATVDGDLFSVEIYDTFV